MPRRIQGSPDVSQRSPGAVMTLALKAIGLSALIVIVIYGVMYAALRVSGVPHAEIELIKLETR